MMTERISKKILYVFIYLVAVTSSILSIGYSSAEEKSETILTTGVAMSGQPASRRNAIEDAEKCCRRSHGYDR